MNSELHRPTSRVLDLLETLAGTENGLTLTELSRAIDAPASSLIPFVRTLLARGYVALNKRDMTYSLGAKNLMLSSGFTAGSDVYALAQDEMRKLVERCSETCQLGILEGSNVFYIGKVDSPEPLRLVSSVGKSIPACCTAIGKALLCDFSKEAVAALYPSGLPSLTPASLRSLDELYDQVVRVRSGGFATDVEEAMEHLRCFALPIRLHGRIDSAISVSTPTFRLDAEKTALVQQCLIETRDKIERHLEQAGHGLGQEMSA